MKLIPTIVLMSSIGLAMPLYAANLSSDSHITSSLMSAAVGDQIRKKCPTISARMTTALSKAWALKSYAKSLGATDNEIDAFLKSKTEQNRIRKLTKAYLQKNGVVEGQPQTYCALGKAEIKKGSLIGSLLK